tara:strand:+ start:756 stop:1367 length:612 start_codon:yes stop_codon:yes gene_type:complete
MHQSGSTILLIEDDPTYIHVLEYEFSTMGWTIETVTNAEAARNYLSINKPEIIVSDVKLPDCSGIDLSSEFSDLSPDSLIILITGYPDLEDSIRALRGHVYDYLLKPFKIEQLILIIERARSMYILQQENNRLNFENNKLKKILTDKGTNVEELLTQDAPKSSSAKIESPAQMYARQIRRSKSPMIDPEKPTKQSEIPSEEKE